MPLPPMLPGPEHRNRADELAGRSRVPTDRQREGVSLFLGEAYAAGRLRSHELEERRGRVYAAAVIADLDQVFAGLVIPVAEPDLDVRNYLSFTHVGSEPMRLSSGQLDALATAIAQGGDGSESRSPAPHGSPARSYFLPDYLLSSAECNELEALVERAGFSLTARSSAYDTIRNARQLQDLLGDPLLETIRPRLGKSDPGRWTAGQVESLTLPSNVTQQATPPSPLAHRLRAALARGRRPSQL